MGHRDPRVRILLDFKLNLQFAELLATTPGREHQAADALDLARAELRLGAVQCLEEGASGVTHRTNVSARTRKRRLDVTRHGALAEEAAKFREDRPATPEFTSRQWRLVTTYVAACGAIASANRNVNPTGIRYGELTGPWKVVAQEVVKELTEDVRHSLELERLNRTVPKGPALKAAVAQAERQRADQLLAHKEHLMYDMPTLDLRIPNAGTLSAPVNRQLAVWWGKFVRTGGDPRRMSLAGLLAAAGAQSGRPPAASAALAGVTRDQGGAGRRAPFTRRDIKATFPERPDRYAELASTLSLTPVAR